MSAVFPDGLIAIVKRDCPTCVLVVPVLNDLRERGGEEDSGEGKELLRENDLAGESPPEICALVNRRRFEGVKANGKGRGKSREASPRDVQDAR